MTRLALLQNPYWDGNKVKLTVAHKIGQYLADHGCTHAFGIVGGANLHVYATLAEYMQVIPMCHEQAAAIAACGYTKASGRIAPVLVTNGSGSINAFTGVMEAYMDSVPMLVLSGNEMVRFWTTQQKHSRSIGFQGFDSAGMAIHCCKLARSAWNAEEVEYYLGMMLEKAHEPRQGPCWLDIPQDVARITYE